MTTMQNGEGMPRTELLGGPQDGAVVDVDYFYWDIPMPLPLPALAGEMRPPLIKVARYRRISETRMRFEGVVMRYRYEDQL